MPPARMVHVCPGTMGMVNLRGMIAVAIEWAPEKLNNGNGAKKFAFEDVCFLRY